MFTVYVTITPKAGISDPQGAVIERALPNLGFEGVGKIRVGRFISLQVDGEEEAVVRKDVDDMCRQLLANPIIEDFRFELVPADLGLHGPDSIILGADDKPREAPPHAASPWTAADEFAAGADLVADEETPPSERAAPAPAAGRPAEPSPWTAVDPYATREEEETE